MDSEVFFKSEKAKYYKTRQGVYVINMPLFKDDGKDIYKVGFARDNVEKRLKDYKTAYGPVHFIIECILEVPEKVFHKRANFARLSETRIHKTLISKMKYNHLVMKDEETDKQLGEWFYNLEDIMAVMKGLRVEYTTDDIIKDVAMKWDFTYNEKYDYVKPFLDIYDEKKIKSKLSNIIVIDRTPLNRNKGKKLNKTDDIYVYDKEYKNVVASNKLGIGAPPPPPKKK